MVPVRYLSITYGNFQMTITYTHLSKKGTYVAREGTVRSFGGQIHIISNATASAVKNRFASSISQPVCVLLTALFTTIRKTKLLVLL
jgi:hypothetical protein